MLMKNMKEGRNRERKECEVRKIKRGRIRLNSEIGAKKEIDDRGRERKETKEETKMRIRDETNTKRGKKIM